MNDPSLDPTASPSAPSATPRFRHVLARLERSSWRSGFVSLGLSAATALALGHDLFPPTAVETFKLAASGLFLFGIAQFVRWTAFHKMMEVHDHFATPHAPRDAERAALIAPWDEFRRPFSLGSAGDVRWFGSTGDAAQRGWHFFEECARFANLPVPRFAEHEGQWHEYTGLAEPDGDAMPMDPPEDTVRFGRLLYRRLPAAPTTPAALAVV